MQIHNDPTPRPGRLASSETLRADLTRSNREGIEERVQGGRPVEGDRIELSPDASRLADAVQANEDSAEHRAKVAALMAQLRNGTLFTPERLERAAENLLGGE